MLSVNQLVTVIRQCLHCVSDEAIDTVNGLLDIVDKNARRIGLVCEDPHDMRALEAAVKDMENQPSTSLGRHLFCDNNLNPCSMLFIGEYLVNCVTFKPFKRVA